MHPLSLFFHTRTQLSDCPGGGARRLTTEDNRSQMSQLLTWMIPAVLWSKLPLDQLWFYHNSQTDILPSTRCRHGHCWATACSVSDVHFLRSSLRSACFPALFVFAHVISCLIFAFFLAAVCLQSCHVAVRSKKVPSPSGRSKMFGLVILFLCQSSIAKCDRAVFDNWG